MKDVNRDPRRNASGAKDLTAYQAIENVTKKEKEKKRVLKVLSTIYAVAELAGFRIDSYIVLVDLKNGKKWR